MLGEHVGQPHRPGVQIGARGEIERVGVGNAGFRLGRARAGCPASSNASRNAPIQTRSPPEARPSRALARRSSRPTTRLVISSSLSAGSMAPPGKHEGAGAEHRARIAAQHEDMQVGPVVDQHQRRRFAHPCHGPSLRGRAAVPSLPRRAPAYAAGPWTPGGHSRASNGCSRASATASSPTRCSPSARARPSPRPRRRLDHGRPVAPTGDAIDLDVVVADARRASRRGAPRCSPRS